MFIAKQNKSLIIINGKIKCSVLKMIFTTTKKDRWGKIRKKQSYIFFSAMQISIHTGIIIENNSPSLIPYLSLPEYMHKLTRWLKMNSTSLSCTALVDLLSMTMK